MTPGSTVQALTIGPSARIDDAERLASHMKTLLQGEADVVEVDVSAVESVDVSFFQLMLAFGQSLNDRQRRLTVLAVPEDHVVSQVSRLLGLPREFHLLFAEAGS